MPAAPKGKGVTWEELFFDLAFVFALTQFSQLLHEDHTWAGVGRTFILFVPVYWAWGGVTLYTNQRDVNSIVDRAGILTLGLSGLLMALTIPEAYHHNGALFVTAYLAGRVLLAGLALRGVPFGRAVLVGPYSSFVITGPLLVAGALNEGNSRLVLWAAAAGVDLLSPWLANRVVAQGRAQPAHYTHRYGLLIILVFGESVIQVGAVAVDAPLTVARLAAITAAYALVSVLWFAYFGYGLSDFRRALEETPDQPGLRRAILVYSHLLFSFGIITIAVGLADMVPAPLEPLAPREAMLLFGGCALFLFTFAYAYWRIHRKIAWRRMGAGGTCLLMAPLATLLPALVMVIALALVAIVMVVTEQRAVRRHGGPAHPAIEVGPRDVADRGPSTEADD
ncbi:low temperature requirement protein A [Micromonospora sp. WMMC250]|uniref:low temperature requirement protein A n=1 Tax=Micromonospora sp. WMMC250 TaxID=3014781 RepID=UPI0022B74789|nr:low temperature requirement protein A [Micromonospora sp. WMMC250]MCZ7374090.1 low temperature requirement protein A [Micromonospora sp. WMMC250]